MRDRQTGLAALVLMRVVAKIRPLWMVTERNRLVYVGKRRCRGRWCMGIEPLGRRRRATFFCMPEDAGQIDLVPALDAMPRVESHSDSTMTPALSP